MATPAFLRYLPARLKPLSAPAVWVPLTVFTLLSVFIWEYHKNPDWFNRPQISNADPNSNLTPEEQARLSEIDTLDLLLRNARTPEGDDLSTSLINPAEQDPLAETLTAPDRSLANRDNPFAAYEEQYQFPGSTGSNSGSAATPQPMRLQTPAASDASSLDFSSSSNSNNSSNVLSEALNRQRSASREAGDRPASGGGAQGVSSSIDSQRSNATSAGSFSDGLGRLGEGNANAGNNGGSFAFPASVPSSNGISDPFIRTTPDMSPPVGTTGYQVPASANLPAFNVPTQQPTRNPFGQPSSLSSPAAPASVSTPATPNVNYTAPSFAQPEQNRRR